MAPETFTGLLAPYSTAEFFREVWGKTFRRYAGSPGRLAELFSWSALNDVLRFHRLDAPRLRLAREGQTLPAGTIFQYDATLRDPSVKIPRLRTGALERALREGATLILDAVDELHAPVSVLVEDMEPLFRVRPQANLYAGWRTSPGFDLHWDDHDVLVAQIAGRKRWSVYGMTKPYPLARDKGAIPPPDSGPLWEGLLEDGDLLYIPRGWWHAAAPLDEPTLHLTIGFTNPTGADLLRWLVDSLAGCEDLRRDLPLFADASGQTRYIDKLQAEVGARLHSGILAEYLAHRDARARPRPHPGLPWTATPSGLPPEEARWRVRWIAPRPAEIVSEPDSPVISLSCNGRKIRFAGAARPLLEALMTRRPISLDELCAAAPDVPRETVRSSIREMVGEELVSFC
jgi:hypothetical protein